MAIKRKLKNQSGFTLAETLLAVLILLLVSTIVANGIPVAQNVYNNVIVGANGQVLLSTAVTALRNELGTARDIQIKGTDIIYFKSSIGAYSKLSVDADNGIQLLDYVNPETGAAIPVKGASDSRAAHNLVSKAASNKNRGDSNKSLIVTYASAAIDTANPDVITFSTILVRRTDGSKATITSLNELKIRLVPEPASEY